jgi:hypothetical protein
MKKSYAPIFVVGSARSGTSLLYAILQASGAFAIYPAETLLLRTCADRYGSLAKKANFRAFINDWIISKQFARSGLDKDHFLYEISHQGITNYFDFLDSFMTLIADNQRKNRWAENTPNHVLELDVIADYFPNSKIIHVIRDGRAVASSLAHLGWTSFNHPKYKLMSAGLHWQTQVLTGRRLGRKLADRYMEVHYEHLVEQPEIILQDLSTFVGTSISMDMLAANPHGALRKSNTVYVDKENNDKLFSQKALTKWKSILSDDEQKMLHSVIGDTLQTFGYPVGKKFSNKQWSFLFCSCIYHGKEWLRHKTILGRYAKTGLEINERKA